MRAENETHTTHPKASKHMNNETLAEMGTTQTLKRFEVTVYEKSEHWTFTVVVEATDSESAKAIVRKSHGKGYVVRECGRA